MTEAVPHDVEGLLRELAPRALGALVRRYGRFGACEDAVQEALLAASVQWPGEGVPERPLGWLITVGARRLTDQLRSDTARQRREEAVTFAAPDAGTVPGADAPAPPEHDDTLTLLFLCCHPSLTAPSQLALTLRAVAGLTTAQIAAAFLTSEATVAQRISRAKQRIRAAGGRFQPPPPGEWTDRLDVVLHVLYLVFTEGHTTTSGTTHDRPDLTAEAIRLTRMLHRLLPEDGEVAGLLALMLLTDARRSARIDEDGSLVPLAEQDRRRWDRAAITEGSTLVAEALARAPVGPYQIQAAIAAVHGEATRAEDTDWRQIAALYALLDRPGANPVVQLNRAVAVAMVDGPAAGLATVDELATDDRLADHHRRHAVRAHLLELAGEVDAAVTAYREAARRTTSLPERRFLEQRADRLVADRGVNDPSSPGPS